MRELWHKGRAIWSEFAKTDASTHASSICYFTFMSIIPLLVICISLVSLTGVDQRQVIEFIQRLVPDALHGLVRSLIDDAFARSDVAFSLSSITLVWTASKSARALRGGLNAAYSEGETRNAVRVTIISIIAVIILGVLIAAVLYLVFGPSILHALASIVPGLQEQDGLVILLDALATLGASVLALAACYTFLPAGKRRFVAQLPGAVLTSIACGVFSFGFRIYVDGFGNYAMLYGSIATVAILLLWMYFTFYIVLVGAFVNRCLATREKRS